MSEQPATNMPAQAEAAAKAEGIYHKLLDVFLEPDGTYIPAKVLTTLGIFIEGIITHHATTYHAKQARKLYVLYRNNLDIRITSMLKRVEKELKDLKVEEVET